MLILERTEHERDLSDTEHALIRKVAEAPPPTPRLATDDDVRNTIGALAGTLKMPRLSKAEGTLKLGMYRKALAGHLAAEALSYAGERALRELQWMPTPAELIALAKPFSSRVAMAHSKARYLCRERAQRLMEETTLALAKRTFPEAEINDLPERWLQIAECQGHIILQLNGRYAYRTREAWQRDVEARINAAERDMGGSAHPNQRPIPHAGDGFHDERKAEGEL